MADAPFDLQKAHRWFAVECNNLAWELADAPSRTPEQAERMVHAAHAACFHWLHAGDLLNHLRAQVLLATAYDAAGLAEAAVRYAEKCLELSDQAGEKQTAFDRATAYGCAARAYASAGRADRAADLRRLAHEAASALDPEDR